MNIHHVAFLSPVLLLAACEHSTNSMNLPSAGDVSSAMRLENQTVSADQNYLITYRIEPDPVPLNDEFSILLYVHENTTPPQALTDIELDVDGRMPHHRHGMNQVPTVVRQPDGGFHVSGMRFHMPGFWEVHFDVTRNAITERAYVDIVLE